ncbi:hypothetical protein TNCV_496011 [Trichonephila clavipes]|nr:hypothetical protein TNCV_496011 [Trichonephila clavipes]
MTQSLWLQKIKQTDMKDAVYWSAESWENVSDQTLAKVLKLWPTLEYAENQTENDVTSLLHGSKACADNSGCCEEATGKETL